MKRVNQSLGMRNTKRIRVDDEESVIAETSDVANCEDFEFDEADDLSFLFGDL